VAQLVFYYVKAMKEKQSIDLIFENTIVQVLDLEHLFPFGG